MFDIYWSRQSIILNIMRQLNKFENFSIFDDNTCGVIDVNLAPTVISETFKIKGFASLLLLSCKNKLSHPSGNIFSTQKLHLLSKNVQITWVSIPDAFYDIHSNVSPIKSFHSNHIQIAHIHCDCAEIYLIFIKVEIAMTTKNVQKIFLASIKVEWCRWSIEQFRIFTFSSHCEQI